MKEEKNNMKELNETIELLNMPILEQMYKSRKQAYEELIKNNNEHKKIEISICKFQDSLLHFLKKIINSDEYYEEARKKVIKCELEYSKEIYFWGRAFYKAGSVDIYKIRKAIDREIDNINEYKTLTEFSGIKLDDYIEHNSGKSAKEYKKLREEYIKIAREYPNVVKVYNKLEPIMLNDKEMKILVELRRLDMEIKTLENKLCFELGMNEILNF